MRRWIERKKEAVIYLGGACRKCGYRRNYAALDFHHQEPSDKAFNWQQLRLRPWKSVLSELDKYQLLCRNCHAEEHNPQAAL